MNMDSENLLDLADIAPKLEAGGLDAILGPLYPGRELDGVRRRYGALIQSFADAFGGGRAALFSTPGRTEIGGNHTDHQHGCVLAGSVDMDIIAVVRPISEKLVRLRSDGYPETVVHLDSLAPNPAEFNHSSALVRGIAAQFADRGFPVSGLEIAMTSSVLKGSGLSSSAAFEVMLGTIMNHLFAGGILTPVEVCTIGRYAENCYFGKPCGLMDQLACCVGGVQFIDFKNIDNPLIKKLSGDFRSHGLALCIIDSGADHADLTDEYSPIPREMGMVAAHFGKPVLREVDKAAFLREIPVIRREAGDRAVIRALHFYGDNERTVCEAEAVEKGDIGRFLELLNESGRSSHMYLQNVYPLGSTVHQDVGLALALCDELLEGRGAFRIHGGGFAGTVQAFVPLDALDRFRTGIEAVFGGGRCHVVAIREAGSVRLI
ncbi:MAG: hypothetical protein LUC93_17000 [Planctomycetaceae bacterium]|nr:hypothetical protein [Planctomycetaceae bacterium]